MNEKIINLEKNNAVVGILSSSTNNIYSNNDICVIFINAGLIHKIGPNGLYVKMARSLAIDGITTFRFDFSGLGDSEISINSLDYEKNKISEIQLAMDCIFEKTGINRFVLSGMCTGAEDAFKAAKVDDRIMGLILIDGIYQEREFVEKIYNIALKNCAIRYYKKHIFSFKRWVKIITGKSNIVRLVLKIIIYSIRGLSKKIFLKGVKHNENVDADQFAIDDWIKLLNKNIKTYLIFSEGSPMIDVFNLTIAKQLKDYTNNHNLQINVIKDVDHNFTPIWAQELSTTLICKWIKINLN